MVLEYKLLLSSCHTYLLKYFCNFVKAFFSIILTLSLERPYIFPILFKVWILPLKPNLLLITSFSLAVKLASFIALNNICFCDFYK